MMWSAKITVAFTEYVMWLTVTQSPIYPAPSFLPANALIFNLSLLFSAFITIDSHFYFILSQSPNFLSPFLSFDSLPSLFWLYIHECPWRFILHTFSLSALASFNPSSSFPCFENAFPFSRFSVSLSPVSCHGYDENSLPVAFSILSHESHTYTHTICNV